MNNLFAPQYGERTLADLVPSICDVLVENRAPVLNIPKADRYLLVLVDGLGFNLLCRAERVAPYLASLIREESWITSAVPSTTATSLSCIGTGLAPGQHGIVGYSFRDPNLQVMNALTFNTGADPYQIQPNETRFEYLAKNQVVTSNISLARFEDSALSIASHRGARFLAVNDERDFEARVGQAVEASVAGEKTFSYLYERNLDHAGHSVGTRTKYWQKTLTKIDKFLADLRQQLDPSVCLIVTGDHGMIDIPGSHRLIVEDEPQLSEGVADIAGEARFRQIYTSTPATVAERWRRLLGDRARVFLKDEAIELGWFGKVADSVYPRIGDVLVAMSSDWAVLTNRFPGEFNIVGMHGSISSEETRVPLLIDY